MLKTNIRIVAVTLLAIFACTASNATQTKGPDVKAWLKDGSVVEGAAADTRFTFAMPEGSKTFSLKDVLSFNSGDAATTDEERAIEKLLPQVGGADRAASEKAVATLTEIGLPVMTPLLKSYKDTDMHEPYPLYRLFARIMPSYADGPSARVTASNQKRR